MTARERVALFGLYALSNGLFLGMYSWEVAAGFVVICVLVGVFAA